MEAGNCRGLLHRGLSKGGTGEANWPGACLERVQVAAGDCTAFGA